MIKKQNLLIIVLIFCISLFLITNWSSFNKKINQIKDTSYNQPIDVSQNNEPKSLCESVKFTQPKAEEIEYNEVIKNDPLVKYLRFTLDKYTTNDFSPCDENCTIPGLYRGKHFEDTAYGDLQNYSSQILKSKFIVLETETSSFGGQSIVLMFKDSPDKLYYAQIYGEDDYFDLRGFSEYTPPKTIEEVQEIFINQLCSEDMEI